MFVYSDLLISFATRTLVTCIVIRSITTSSSKRYFGIVIATSIASLETVIDAPFYDIKTSIWLAFWHNNIRLLRHSHRDFVCWLSHSDAFAFFSISTLDISLINTTTFRHSDLLTSFANLITCVRIQSTTTSFSNRYFSIVISTSVVCLETALFMVS